MSIARFRKNGTVELPEAVRASPRLAEADGFWVEERDGELLLHPRVRDIKKLYVEPTTGCNLTCRTCIRNVWSDPVGAMSAGTWNNLQEQLADLPQLSRVVFTGFGEPLSHPRILEMVADVRARDIAVSLGTNGLLLDAAMARDLVQLGVDRLVVSVDGVDPAVYADVRGAQLEQVLDNIRLLNEAKRQLDTLIPALGIEFVVLRSNLHELPQLTGLASRLCAARVLVSNVLCYTAEMKEQMLYGYDPQPSLLASGWPVRTGPWVTWGTVELPRMHWGAERQCKFVHDHSTVIGWDGAVTPCYALSHNYEYLAIDGVKKSVARYALGDVNRQRLEEIWMSEDYVRFRSEVRAFHFPSCPNCDLRETCDLRQQNEACWGWNPSCADCLWAQDIVRCP
ncbi:MAG TPA: tungsten cofactor oxidoreductase radical SAM maturase [Anaerolineae bacterium]|nr:tungsten cofactor oxidoreductase radical SAM maturase [Anaerolineae bacterium]HNT05098.1 tungsten cofactor oxidoreductase radical SAM maturase [Anaerolineae bacterium]